MDTLLYCALPGYMQIRCQIKRLQSQWIELPKMKSVQVNAHQIPRNFLLEANISMSYAERFQGSCTRLPKLGLGALGTTNMEPTWGSGSRWQEGSAEKRNRGVGG